VQFDLEVNTALKDTYDLTFTVIDEGERVSAPVTKQVVFK